MQLRRADPRPDWYGDTYTRARSHSRTFSIPRCHVRDPNAQRATGPDARAGAAQHSDAASICGVDRPPGSHGRGTHR